MLSLFTPLSFAATEPWAFLVMQAAICLIIVYFLFKRRSLVISFSAVVVSCIFIFLISYSAIQLFNPRSITQPVSIFPFTLCRFYTLTELMSFLTYFLLFTAVTQLFESYKKITKALFLFSLSAGVVAVVSVCFPKGEYINFFLDKNISSAFGPFVNRNSAGIFFSMSFFITLTFTITGFFKYKKYLYDNKKNEFIIRQAIQILLSIFLLICVILTRSRGAMLATFISLFSFSVLSAFYLPKESKRKIKYTAVLIFLFVILSFCILKNFDSINSFSGRYHGGFSEQARKILYKSAFDMLKDYPLTGVGVAAFPVAVNKYLETPIEAYPEHLHNDWLELILGIGYPAGVLLIILASFLIYNLLSRIKFLRTEKQICFIGLLTASFTLLLGSLVDFHLHIPANAFVFFSVLGLLSAASFHKNKIYEFNMTIYFKSMLIIMLICMIYVSARNTFAWKYFVFGENLSPNAKIEYYEEGISLTDNPRYLEKLILLYYNAAFNNSFPVQERQYYYQKALGTSKDFLIKYPFSRQISKVYSNLSSVN